MNAAELMAMRLAQAALRNAVLTCQYHGTDYDRLGTETPEGLPRCDSCKQPWRVRRALDAIGRLS